MNRPQRGPTEKVAWIVSSLSLAGSLMFVLGAIIGEPSALTVAAAAMTALGGGLWFGKALEARAVRTGRNRLRP